MGTTGLHRPNRSEMLNLGRWGIQMKKDFIELMLKYENGEHFMFKHTIDCCDETYTIFTQESLGEAYGRNMKKVWEGQPVEMVFKARHEDGTQIEDFTLETLETYYRVIFNRWPGFTTSAKNLLVKEHITSRTIGFCKYSNFIYQFMIPIDLRKVALEFSRSTNTFIEVHQDDVFPSSKSKGPLQASNSNVYLLQDKTTTK